jgi:hypothetical protein
MPNTAVLQAFGAKLHEQRQVRELGARFFGDVHDDSPGPCPNCPHAERCSAQGQACDQFALFVRFGGMERWRLASRQPTAEIFLRLFGPTGHRLGTGFDRTPRGR